MVSNVTTPAVPASPKGFKTVSFTAKVGGKKAAKIVSPAAKTMGGGR